MHFNDNMIIGVWEKEKKQGNLINSDLLHKN